MSGDNKMEKEDLTASMLRYMTCVIQCKPLPIFLYQYVYRDKCNSAGEVVAIVEEPQTGEYKV